MNSPSIQLLRAIAAADAASAAVATASATVSGIRRSRPEPVVPLAGPRRRPISAATRRLLTSRCTLMPDPLA